jgi:hypothetical protein
MASDTTDSVETLYRVRGRDQAAGPARSRRPERRGPDAWHAKETVRGIAAIDDPDLAAEFVDEVADDRQDPGLPPEVRSLGRTLRRWFEHIVTWYHARVSNGPTEAATNLIKRIKRVGFGFRRFAHCRTWALLYAGNPTGTYSPPSHRRLKSEEP